MDLRSKLARLALTFGVMVSAAGCGSSDPPRVVTRESSVPLASGAATATTGTPGASASPAAIASASPSRSAATASASPPDSPSASGPVGPPPPRIGAQLVWDRVLQLDVLLNGENADRTVWGWNGTAWQIVTPNGPEARAFGGTVYDNIRDEYVVYGGSEPAACVPRTVIGTHGFGWPTQDTAAPPACDHLATAEAPHGSPSAPRLSQPTVVLFGGRTVEADLRRPLDQTWIWQGGEWERQNVPGPPARIDHAMAFDPERNVTVLFGGRSNGTDVNDTWEWDGEHWRKATPAGPSPIAREAAAMAFDPVTKTVLLFGGASAARPLGDTWSWNGTAWKQLATKGPAARQYHAMAPALDRDRVVLFGGSAGESFYNDTWEWDGSAWACIAECARV